MTRTPKRISVLLLISTRGHEKNFKPIIMIMYKLSLHF